MNEFFFGKPRSQPVMCKKNLSLHKLRKIAMENGVNIYSESKTRLNKKTGELLKPKKVLCGTLIKRLAQKRSPRRSSRIEQKRSPRRSQPVMCKKNLSLHKLRKIALENGVNIYSESKTRLNKKTGEPLKPKKVLCGTLIKRLKDAGMDYLFEGKHKDINKNNQLYPELLFNDEDVQPSSLFNDEDDRQSFVGPCKKNFIMRDGTCVDISSLSQSLCSGDDLLWNKLDNPPRCVRKPKPPSERLFPPPLPKPYTPYYGVIQADPACDSEFKKFLKANPGMKKEYKGYAVGSGPCSSREFIPTRWDVDEDELSDYGDEAGFDMNFGARHRLMSGTKRVGRIVVNGRYRVVYKGVEGGLYYHKDNNGKKIYIDKKRLNKK